MALQCAPHFCCQQPNGCNYMESFKIDWTPTAESKSIYLPEKGIICAKYRDYESILCSRCIKGKYELFSTTECGECNDYNSLLWLIVIFLISIIFVIYIKYISK
eukprot:60558_1